MKSKAEQTTEFIIEKVAPVFNKKGYTATSLSDLEEATGLTKGAIYGNFESKEDLAVKAFQYNFKKVNQWLYDFMIKGKNPTEKLFLMTEFYRNYYDFMVDFGGCPIINVTIDAKNINPTLYALGCYEAKKMEGKLTKIIQMGIESKEFKETLNAEQTAKVLYTMIDGSILMSFSHLDKTYLETMMDFVDNYIRERILQPII
ncbi:hypothetical protein AD998_09625 [bacterium 336/3]|nr:hypothetical protein AD998_09625 [bacterium 336/3]